MKTLRLIDANGTLILEREAATAEEEKSRILVIPDYVNMKRRIFVYVWTLRGVRCYTECVPLVLDDVTPEPLPEIEI